VNLVDRAEKSGREDVRPVEERRRRPVDEREVERRLIILGAAVIGVRLLRGDARALSPESADAREGKDPALNGFITSWAGVLMGVDVFD
jgi:hypothetical protein